MKWLILSFHLIIVVFATAQDSININGMYHAYGAFNENTIEFRPSGFFQQKICGCFVQKNISGIYKIEGDTIKVYALSNDSILIKKYFYRNEFSCYSSNFKCRFSLFEINPNSSNESTQNEYYTYSLSVGYYKTGEKEFEIKTINDRKTDIYFYHKNGTLKLIQHYKMGLKYGNWLYFDDKMKKTRTEIYRKGLLKKIIAYT